jgi:hypothetical protein
MTFIRIEAADPRELRDRRRRRPSSFAAWSASIGLHALMVLALFGSASGRLIAMEGADDHQSAIAIAMVPAASLNSAPPPSATEALRPLLAKYGSDQPPVDLPTDTDHAAMRQLLARLGTAAPSALSSSANAAAAPSAPPSAEAASEGRGKRGRGPNSDTSGATGGLWAVIEPCWTRLAVASPVPVVLEIRLDARGKLSTPPRILRDGDPALTETQLRAEANALAAVAACLPQGDLRFSARLYRLEFRPTG